MADGLPVAEGGRPGAKGGGKNWLVIGAIAGVGTLAVLMLQNKGAQGTTAAGTSINAALGSVQEQNLNIMGLISKSAQDIMDEVAAGDSLIESQLTDVNGNVLVGNNMSLDQLQQTFKQYAASNFGYMPNLGGGAGYLALPQNWQDFMHFIMNPSLADPKYQASLMQSRGYVFHSQAGYSDPSSTGLSTLGAA